jgi:NAD(P)-dependent dehydrogenase (short-subunit alcohol dehydrogenase family)
MSDFSGQVAVVTGGEAGIGMGCAEYVMRSYFSFLARSRLTRNNVTFFRQLGAAGAKIALFDVSQVGVHLPPPCFSKPNR